MDVEAIGARGAGEVMRIRMDLSRRALGGKSISRKVIRGMTKETTFPMTM